MENRALLDHGANIIVNSDLASETVGVALYDLGYVVTQSLNSYAFTPGKWWPRTPLESIADLVPDSRHPSNRAIRRLIVSDRVSEPIYALHRSTSGRYR
jgi:hypothetical protein